MSPAGEVEPGLPFSDPHLSRQIDRRLTRAEGLETYVPPAATAGLPVPATPPAAMAVVGAGVVRTPPALVPSLCELPTRLDDLPLFGFVCGVAGSGKTFWAKELSRNKKGCTLAATTGIAAVNLGEGTTINALCKYFNTESLREAYTSGYLEATLKKHRGAGLQRILLDEVSMLSGDQLTILTRAIDNVNQDRPEDAPELGLLLVGDLCQLPPVKEPFAFESAEWARYAEHTLALTRIWRQADRDFIRALHAVRRGDVRAALDYFAPRLQSVTLQDFPGPTIVAKNEAVDKYNGLRADKLHTPLHKFPSSRWGDLRPEWGKPPKPRHEWVIPEVLGLKEGSRVMVLANKNLALGDEPALYAYTNGDLGTFVESVQGYQAPGELTERSLVGARVKLDRTGDVVTVGYLTRENKIPLEPGRAKQLRAEGKADRISEDRKYEITGAITYVPLRLAYATTCFKSQGLSLDAVQINIRDPFFSLGGMLYVALSRARTAEGLRIVGTEQGFRARCQVNPKVKEWL